MSITVLIHRSNNNNHDLKRKEVSVIRTIIWVLPEIIDFMQVIWVVVAQDMTVIFQNCLE